MYEIGITNLKDVKAMLLQSVFLFLFNEVNSFGLLCNKCNEYKMLQKVGKKRKNKWKDYE